MDWIMQLELPSTMMVLLCEVLCEKWQEVVPTMQGRKNADGTISAPPLEDMYPFLSREEFHDNMIIKPLD